MGLNLSESMCPSSDDDGMVFDDVVIRCSGEIHPKVVEGKKKVVGRIMCHILSFTICLKFE